MSVQDAKVSRLMVTSLKILVNNAQFSVTLATSWLQFRTLICLKSWVYIFSSTL